MQSSIASAKRAQVSDGAHEQRESLTLNCNIIGSLVSLASAAARNTLCPMKQNLAAFLGLACAALAVALFVAKRSDNAQHETDAGAIADYSNQLSSVQTDIAICRGKLTVISNQLNSCQSASLTLSNRMVGAQSALANAAEQITNLNQQLTQSESENQTLNQRIAELTNQAAGFTNLIASTKVRLDQANKDYALLEKRFRRDVAERLLAERKFNNRSALKAQLEYLNWNPPAEISADRIREGLDVVVKSNVCYVIAPD